MERFQEVGSIPGVIVGAVALYGLPELLREFSEYRLLVFGADGRLRDSAGRWIGPEFYVRSEGTHASASSLPFGRVTEVVVFGDATSRATRSATRSPAAPRPASPSC